jgi:tRNA pseudouridine55 synthase
MTSFGVVAAVKRLCHERRVGHAGTLDPLATGVLPVCLGKATRVAEFLMESRKTYRAEVELGVSTDTGDAEGRVIQRTDASGIDRDALLSTLGGFLGKIQQTPPMFSAVKYHGQPLYKLARAGITVERRSRQAEIYDLTLLSWESPVAEIEVTCSRGTYIRALAQDLGQALGCGAHLKNLVRLRCGPFDISDSVSLAQLDEASDRGDWQCLLYPPDSVLLHWPAIVAGAELEDSIRHGRPFPGRSIDGGLGPAVLGESKDRCRAYTLDGCFLGVLRFNSEKDEWQPEKVFS